MSKTPEVKYPAHFIIEMNEYYSNKMRARIFNLVDATFADPEQRKSFKGLIKDFTSEAHYSLNKDIISFLIDHKIMPNNVSPGPSQLVDDPRIGAVAA